MSKPVNPPLLRFEGQKEVVGWTGSWPPPEAFLIAVGKESGVSAHIDLSDFTDHQRATLATLRAEGLIDEYEYERESYSELPESIDHEANSHVVRSAFYVLVSTPE